MDFLDIVMELRKMYRIQIPEEDYENLVTMSSTVNFLTPLFRIIDRFLPWKGLSWIVIARKVDVPATCQASTPRLQKRLAA